MILVQSGSQDPVIVQLLERARERGVIVREVSEKVVTEVQIFTLVSVKKMVHGDQPSIWVTRSIQIDGMPMRVSLLMVSIYFSTERLMKVI